MTPEQQHQDAVEASREWRDEQRRQVPESGHLPEGNSLLREIAEESDGQLVEVAPGRFYVSKLAHGGLS